jgi:hypothetical protein
MNEPTDHDHQWVPAINGMFSICQICQWRRSHIDGSVQPPDDKATNAKLTD